MSEGKQHLLLEKLRIFYNDPQNCAVLLDAAATVGLPQLEDRGLAEWVIEAATFWPSFVDAS
jgi:hypothetical protein